MRRFLESLFTWIGVLLVGTGIAIAYLIDRVIELWDKVRGRGNGWD